MIKANGQKIHNDPKQAKTSSALLGTSGKTDFNISVPFRSVDSLPRKLVGQERVTNP